MGKSSRWATGLVAVFAFYLTACSNPQEVGEIKAKVDEIQAQQKDILAKLDGLQKGQKTILAKAPAAAAKPRTAPLAWSSARAPASAPEPSSASAIPGCRSPLSFARWNAESA